MCRDSHFTAGTSTDAVNAGVLTEDSALAEHSLDPDCLRWQTGRNCEQLGRERLNAMHASTSDRCRSRPCGPNDHCGTVRADEARTPELPGTARPANRCMRSGHARSVSVSFLAECLRHRRRPLMWGERSRTATSPRTTCSPHPRHCVSRTTYEFPRFPS